LNSSSRPSNYTGLLEAFETPGGSHFPFICCVLAYLLLPAPQVSVFVLFTSGIEYLMGGVFGGSWCGIKVDFGLLYLFIL